MPRGLIVPHGGPIAPDFDEGWAYAAARSWAPETHAHYFRRLGGVGYAYAACGFLFRQAARDLREPGELPRCYLCENAVLSKNKQDGGGS